MAFSVANSIRLLFFLAVFPSGLLPSPADAASSLQGLWKGTLSCDNRRASPLVLFLRPDGISRVRGVLEFGRGSQSGAYEVRGQAEADGSFALDAGRWVRRAWSGERPFDVEGRILPDGMTIEARLPQCKIGELHATREATSEAARRSKPDLLSPKAAAWADDIRKRIAAFRIGGDGSSRLWQPIRTEIALRMPHGGSRELRDELVEALDEARASIGSDALLARLAQEGTAGGDAAVSAAVRIANEARNRRWWPKPAVDRVVSAARERVVELTRPQLQALAAMAPKLPVTLDGLIKAREALAPVEARRGAMTRAFGSVDPEKRLEPLARRLAEIEASGEIAAELRAALKRERASADPIGATARLLTRAFGTTPPSALAPLIKEAGEHAVFAAIIVEDKSTERHPGEPTARAFALALHNHTRWLNDLITSQEARCRSGRYANVLDATACGPIVLLDKMGGLRARPKRVTKLGCEVEEPGVRYMCRFNQDLAIHSAKGGLLAPDLTRRLLDTVMPGYQGEVTQARFRRIGEPGQRRWEITRPDRPEPPPVRSEPPLQCPWGEIEIGGFCSTYTAFD